MDEKQLQGENNKTTSYVDPYHIVVRPEEREKIGLSYEYIRWCIDNSIQVPNGVIEDFLSCLFDEKKYRLWQFAIAAEKISIEAAKRVEKNKQYIP